MSVIRSPTVPLTWSKAALFITGAVTFFHAAYWPTRFKLLSLAILGYVICLVQLARLSTARQAFYAGLITGFLCVTPQLTCFWKIFGPGAIVLWAVLGFWIGAFTGMSCAALRRFGPAKTALLIPFFWMGLEYFRSELYYLKFSWMNVGYALSGSWFGPHYFGIYGIGFVAALLGALFFVLRTYQAAAITICALVPILWPPPATIRGGKPTFVNIAGVQMEFPPAADLPRALDALLAEHTNADVLVLSEYTLDGTVPDSLKDWCREHQRYLVVGGKDPAPNNNFYNTAFVVGTNGEIVFRQVKSVPIQFFKDGLPAPKQDVWDSPWGKIGFCVCYDLSYTRVIDGLIKKGAQLIIAPTMDVVDWGERQHELHALVAPVRAAEYGIPIFRLASSGISQAVENHGVTIGKTPFAGEESHLFATFHPVHQTSFPMDRRLAPLAVGITGIFLVLLCFTKPKQKTASVSSETQPKELATATSNQKDLSTAS